MNYPDLSCEIEYSFNILSNIIHLKIALQQDYFLMNTQTQQTVYTDIEYTVNNHLIQFGC